MNDGAVLVDLPSGTGNLIKAAGWWNIHHSRNEKYVIIITLDCEQEPDGWNRCKDNLYLLYCLFCSVFVFTLCWYTGDELGIKGIRGM